jgi:hypothetical protein
VTSPLPIDVPSLLTDSLPDAAHEAIRQTVISALQVVWSDHQSLVAQLNDQAAQITALTARVTALEPPVIPPPA